MVSRYISTHNAHFIVLTFLSVVNMWMYVHICMWYQQRPYKSIKSLEARVTSVCELLIMEAGIQTPVLVIGKQALITTEWSPTQEIEPFKRSLGLEGRALLDDFSVHIKEDRRLAHCFHHLRTPHTTSTLSRRIEAVCPQSLWALVFEKWSLLTMGKWILCKMSSEMTERRQLGSQYIYMDGFYPHEICYKRGRWRWRWV